MAAVNNIPIPSSGRASFMVCSGLCYPEAYHERSAGTKVPANLFQFRAHPPMPNRMDRRDFLKLAATAAAAGPLAGQQTRMPAGMTPAASSAKEISGTVFNLEIAPVTVELAPNRIVSTIGYNGMSPGPLLRMKEGAPVTVKVVNKTDTPEYVHFHGLLIPADVDGSEEEGTPPVPPHGSQSYKFTPTPAGTRWYHTHAMSMDDLHRGTYTGQFGFLIVEGGANPGNYDQEHYLALRDWEPYFTTQYMDTDDPDPSGPKPET